MLKKYTSVIILLIPLLLLPFPWYSKLNANSATYEFTDVNGFFVIVSGHSIILFLYIIVLITALLTLNIKKELFFVNSVFILLLIFTITIFPVFFISEPALFYKNFNIGYYVTVFALLISGLNLKLSIYHK